MIVLERGVFSGELNMAVDYVLGSWTKRLGEPILRFYGWEQPTLSLGRFQKLEGIKIPNGIAVVRRPSGGRAVLHHHELTYCLAVPTEHPLGKLSVLEFHKIVHETIRRALLDLGFDAEVSNKMERSDPFCFRTVSRYEITVGGKKVVGSAQFRTVDAVVEHGSIVLSLDRELVAEIFGEIVGKAGGLWEFKHVGIGDLEESLESSFERVFGKIKREESLMEEILKEAHNLKEMFKAI